MKRTLFALIAGTILLGVTAIANATLVGDDVTAQHYFSSMSSPYGNLATATVTDDATDVMLPHNGSWYTVDVNADSFYVDYVNSATWSSASFNGLFVDSLNDSSGNSLQSVSIVTNMNGWDISRLTFDADSVWLNWNGLSFNSDTYVDVSLDFGQQTVPEPSTMILFGTGLVGLIGYRRKRMNRKG